VAATRTVAVLAGAAPGFLLGIHLGGLLFFLNPHLPFAVGPVARAALLYGALGALASGAALAPLALRHPRRALRLLPWMVTAALVLAALLDSVHASHYAYFLPSGINDRLIKAALWLTLGALVCFYTALLHTLHRRPYGVRSRIAVWLMAVASVYLMVERREAFEPRPERARPTEIEASLRPALLVVGLDSATLDALLPMAEEGRTPFLASLLQQGAYGRLASFEPYRPEALWTTLATGKYPFEHGVLGGRVHAAGFVAPKAELRLLPVGLGFARWGTFGLPRQAEDGAVARRARTLWEALPLLGVTSGVVGWPAVSLVPDGVSPGPEFVFPDGFFAAAFDPAGALPPALAERAWIFRVRREELDPRHLARFEPEAPGPVLEAFAGDLWRQSVTRFLVEQGEARAVFLRLPGLTAASARSFGGYEARRFEGRQGPELERATALLGAYYTQIDSLVAELWNELPAPRLLAVVAASGVEAPGGLEWAWRALRGRPPVRGELSGAPDGLLLLLGEGIRGGTLITGARSVDTAPTLMYSLGLPVARDLTGRVLTEAFTPEFLAAHPLTFVPSYETLAPLQPQPPRPPKP